MTDNNQHVNEQDEWRVGEFWSSASPGKKVLILSRADQIGSDSGHKDFIRWVVGSRAALAHPIGQQAGASGEGADGIAADRLARANSSNFSSGCNVGVEHDHSEGGHHD